MNFDAKMIYSNRMKWWFSGLFLMMAIPVIAQHKISSVNEALNVEKKANKRISDTSKINRLLELSEFYRNLEPKSGGNTTKAIQFAKQALGISQQLKFRQGEGKSYLIYAVIEQDLHNFKKTIYWATKAANCFKSIKEYNLLGESQVMQWSGATLLQNPVAERAGFLIEANAAFGKANNKSRQGDCMRELGDLYQYNNKFSEALPVLKLAIKYYISAGRKDLYGVYELLGTTYSCLGNYKEALRYGLLAMKNAEQLEEKSPMLCSIFNRLGTTYYYIHDYQKALVYYQKALDIAILNNDLRAVNMIYDAKIAVLNLTGKYQEAKLFLDDILKKYPKLIKIDPISPNSFYLGIYHNLGQEKKAADYFSKLEKLLKGKYSAIIQKTPSVFEVIINYLIDIRSFEKAAYYNGLYHEMMDHNNFRRKASVYLYQFKIDSVSGNYISAIKSLQDLKKVEEKTSNEETQRQINQLDVLYETEKKDRNITTLTKTTDEQQQNLLHVKKIRNITFIALTLLIVILILSVLGYYQKKKTNKLLQKRQQTINDANESLQHLVTEKEWLLREIHHRVKNNLHMVAGLLASQTEFIKGKEALQAISDSQNRVQAMSIIHQKLYQTETLSHINMATYINELTEYLDSSFSGKCPVKFKLDIESVDFPLSHSIPVGLIINEAVTNSMKYAFEVCGDCCINILLKKTQNSQYLLQIRDNGIGMPENFNISESNSLGMRLIEGLSSDIHAELKIYNENGSIIEILFTLSENNAEKIAS